MTQLGSLYLVFKRGEKRIPPYEERLELIGVFKDHPPLRYRNESYKIVIVETDIFQIYGNG